MENTSETNATDKVAPERDLGGAWVKLGTKQYKVPPLNMRAVRTLLPKLEGLSGLSKGMMPSPDQMVVISEVVHSAISRSYPNMTLEDVEEDMDLGNMTEAFNAVMAISGLEKKEGEPGERPAGS